jgi:ergothioneine biosynthesis protein EgtC
MCRLLAYLGQPIQLEKILMEPEHSLVVQSYQPQEMTAGLLNADGFGMGWYHSTRETAPFTYRNTLPIWNDVNLPNLSRYVESGCVLANVRSATPGLAVDLSNCQPFQQNLILFVHNGYINQFRETLYRPLRDRLSDSAYQTIQGLTDSEHIFALFTDILQMGATLTEALTETLKITTELAEKHHTFFSANIVVSDGKQLVASRYAYLSSIPTLYSLRKDDSVLIASEPLFNDAWTPIPDCCIVTVDHDLNFKTQHL